MYVLKKIPVFPVALPTLNFDRLCKRKYLKKKIKKNPTYITNPVFIWYATGNSGIFLGPKMIMIQKNISSCFKKYMYNAICYTVISFL